MKMEESMCLPCCDRFGSADQNLRLSKKFRIIWVYNVENVLVTRARQALKHRMEGISQEEFIKI